MPKPIDVIEKEVDKLMDDYVDEVFRLSQEKLIAMGKIDTGTMLKTANVNRKFLEKEIVYPAVWSDIIEFGRAPGTMPPVDALINWVRRKLNVKSEKEARRIAFAIAIAIKQRGLEPFPYIQPSILQANAKFGLEVL